MKRSTPLKRTGGLHRGGRLRPRAKKRKAWKAPAVMAEFSETYFSDQLEGWLRGPKWAQVKAGYSLPITLMRHHIFHAAKRVDKWSNLILISSRAHLYAHDDPIGSTVACMLAVVHRDGDLKEIRSHWAEGSVKEPLAWLHEKMVEEKVPDWYMPMANELLRIFSCDVEECRGA